MTSNPSNVLFDYPSLRCQFEVKRRGEVIIGIVLLLFALYLIYRVWREVQGDCGIIAIAINGGASLFLLWMAISFLVPSETYINAKGIMEVQHLFGIEIKKWRCQFADFDYHVLVHATVNKHNMVTPDQVPEDEDRWWFVKNGKVVFEEHYRVYENFEEMRQRVPLPFMGLINMDEADFAVKDIRKYIP